MQTQRSPRTWGPKGPRDQFWQGFFHANPKVAEDLGPQGALGDVPYSPFGGPALLGEAREGRLHWLAKTVWQY